MFVKTGDKVRVIAGKDKGKEGTITKTVAGKDRVVVEGVNIVKKHQKPSNEYPQGGSIKSLLTNTHKVVLSISKHLSMYQTCNCLTLQLTNQLRLRSRLKTARKFAYLKSLVTY